MFTSKQQIRIFIYFLYSYSRFDDAFFSLCLGNWLQNFRDEYG